MKEKNVPTFDTLTFLERTKKSVVLERALRFITGNRDAIELLVHCSAKRKLARKCPPVRLNYNVFK